MNSLRGFIISGIVALLLLPAFTAGVQGNGNSSYPAISADGRYVTYVSLASNLVSDDTNGRQDVFVRDRTTGTTTLVSKSTAGTKGNDDTIESGISSDGRYVTFYSEATNLVSGDVNGMEDVFVRDRAAGTTTLVSKNTTGAQGNYPSFLSQISTDGRYVAFYSWATNFAAGDTNGVNDVFVRDRQTGTTTIVSKSTAGVIGDQNSYAPAFTPNGRYVAFVSDSTNLVTGDINGGHDIFVRDRQTGTTTLVSKNSTGMQGEGYSYMPALSDDGRYVTFMSSAANLASADTNDMMDIFVRDRQTGTTTLVSKNTTGGQGDGDSIDPAISSDGRYVAFSSDATCLVTGDTNGKSDIFVRDRQTGKTTLVSKSTAGEPGNDVSQSPSISGDGRYVAFRSDATNLVAGDTNGFQDIFVRDRATWTTYMVSKS